MILFEKSCYKCLGVGLLVSSIIENCNVCLNEGNMVCYNCQNLNLSRFQECSKCCGCGSIYHDENGKQRFLFEVTDYVIRDS